MSHAFKTTLVTLFLALSYAAPVAAGPIEEADIAYERCDYKTAFRLLRPLAEQGNAAAQNTLGVLYANGYGVQQDYFKAAAWYRKAAEQGDPNALNNLGIMYDNGHGVPKDYVQARKWYDLAAARFPATEAEARASAIKNRDGLTAEMTRAQIAEAQRLAREWKPQ
jgi:TPR repeat protein